MRIWSPLVNLVLAFSALALLLSACAGSASNSNSQAPPPPQAPAITTQPTNQSVQAGATATFSVAASGSSPLSYQWQKNGAAISGATSASYTTP
ncbi:MAG TPA: immunoglobulin domain-containing protein, partial [Candidatus Acidoferrales bacterium]|nr:immunoglobulin domain-containing protein [Candidatus Acidoferrales bacterium]